MKSKFSLVELLVVMAMIAVIASLAVPAVVPNAWAQVEAFTTQVLTPSATTVATNTTSAITTEAINVRGENGVGIFAKFKLGAAGTSNVTFSWDVSYDGTTWTTTKPFSTAIAANGTNTVQAFFAYTPETSPPLANAKFIRLGQVANANTTTNATLTIEELRASLYNR